MPRGVCVAGGQGHGDGAGIIRGDKQVTFPAFSPAVTERGRSMATARTKNRLIWATIPAHRLPYAPHPNGRSVVCVERCPRL